LPSSGSFLNFERRDMRGIINAPAFLPERQLLTTDKKDEH